MVGVRLLPLPQHLIHPSSQFAAPKPNLPILGSYHFQKHGAARALSFNGLANAFHVGAIDGGRHVAPLFAGDTVFAWSQVIDRLDLPGRTDVGALRLRLVATKNRPCADFPYRSDRDYDPAVILDLDYWAVMPR